MPIPASYARLVKVIEEDSAESLATVLRVAVAAVIANGLVAHHPSAEAEIVAGDVVRLADAIVAKVVG